MDGGMAWHELWESNEMEIEKKKASEQYSDAVFPSGLDACSMVFDWRIQVISRSHRCHRPRTEEKQHQ